MSNRLSGNSSLAYQGTNANNPPNVIYAKSNPTQNDSHNVALGDIWLNTSNSTAWLLVSLFGTRTSGGVLATWAQLGIVVAALETLTGNSGGAIPPNSGNTIFVQGDGTTIQIIGNALTNTLTASLVPGSFTQTATGNTGGAVSPNSSGNLNIVGDGTTITIVGNPGTHTLTASVINSVDITLTGNSGGAVGAALGNINVVGDGTTIDIVGNPGTNTLTVSIASGGALDTLTGNSGGAVSPNGSGNINILGTAGVITVTGNPGAHSLTIAAGADVATTYDADSGSAVPASGILHIAGGTNINTSAATNVVTVNLDTTLTGITNLTVNNLTVTTSADFSYLTAGVLQSNGSGVITSSEGTDGQILIGSSTGAPAWANITAGSNITITNGHNSISIASSGGGGTTPGLVLLQSYNVAGLSGFTFSGISSSYTSYLVVADCLQLTTASSGQIVMSYAPNAPFSGYSTWIGGVNYYPYNSTTGSNLSVSSANAYYICPVFATGVAQYVSFNMFLYNLTVALTNSATQMSGQGSIASNGLLYQFITTASCVYPGTPVTSITMSLSTGTFTSGTVEVYGLTN